MTDGLAPQMTYVDTPFSEMHKFHGQRPWWILPQPPLWGVREEHVQPCLQKAGRHGPLLPPAGREDV